jgi:hypothetical protein
VSDGKVGHSKERLNEESEGLSAATGSKSRAEGGEGLSTCLLGVTLDVAEPCARK